MLYFLFFCSGLSGLIYQVVWVRVFGNVFGNTIYSSSLVIAVFMLGLGAGSYLVGAWADRRYATAPASLLRTYGYVELVVAALGLSISLVLPRLDTLTAISSSYVIDKTGWFILSPMSFVARGAIAVVLLAPITMLMGGTLTLLIRHRVHHDVDASGWKIAMLYAVNTAGAAAGAFLTDFVLVPAAGLRATQMVAVALNVIAGVGALWLARARVTSRRPPAVRVKPDRPPTVRLKADTTYMPSTTYVVSGFSRTVVFTILALALSGFAAMGIEILWLRHFNVLLGGFRAVFSLVLTVMLAGIGAGSLLGGVIDRRTGKPAQALMLVQALFVAAALAGLGSASFPSFADGRAIRASFAALTPFERWTTELWYNVRPILFEAGLPSVLMGCSFPLANAMIQRAERSVGRRAGALYLANTAGAVCGSLIAGYVLLPSLGIQGSATVLMIAAALATVPLCFATVRLTASAKATASLAEAPDVSDGARRRKADTTYDSQRAYVVSGFGRTVTRSQRDGTAAAALSSWLISGLALVLWLQLPPGYVLRRSLPPQAKGEQLLTVSEGAIEVIAVAEAPGRGRGLITNGHPMSSTALLDQRYMRALAHIPLLSMERPTRVLVIGFGVGNSTHAATLHPSVERVDVADLSRHVLEHASYFRDANGGVLHDPRVTVYVNDGRQHLQMQPESVYDLITLEPPPIAHAGVAALYSREFYALARSRLKPGGYLSQWLPAYQVPAETSLAMARAFIDVFPQTVLLSGMQAELLLLGTSGASIEIDPERLARALERAPEVRADLRRLDLGTVMEIAGAFVGSAETLAGATRTSAAVSDDRPLQEYVVSSAMGSRLGGVPASIFDLSAVGAWCPRCFHGDPSRASGSSRAASRDDQPAPAVAGLDTYLALLDQAYHAPIAEVAAAALAGPGQRRILGSAYLGAVVPDTDAVHNIIGVTLLREGRYGEAAEAFRDALKRRDSVDANWNLGTALAESGQTTEAISYLRRAVQLDPDHGGAQYELGSLLLAGREFAEAEDHFRSALRAMPDSAGAHNDLGIALAERGALDEAIDAFQQALRLEPDFPGARRNLEASLRQRNSDRRRTHEITTQ